MTFPLFLLVTFTSGEGDEASNDELFLPPPFADDISVPTAGLEDDGETGSGLPPWDDSLWLPLFCIYPDPSVVKNSDRQVWCARPHPTKG